MIYLESVHPKHHAPQKGNSQESRPSKGEPDSQTCQGIRRSGQVLGTICTPPPMRLSSCLRRASCAMHDDMHDTVFLPTVQRAPKPKTIFDPSADADEPVAFGAGAYGTTAPRRMRRASRPVSAFLTGRGLVVNLQRPSLPQNPRPSPSRLPRSRRPSLPQSPSRPHPRSLQRRPSLLRRRWLRKRR